MQTDLDNENFTLH